MSAPDPKSASITRGGLVGEEGCSALDEARAAHQRHLATTARARSGGVLPGPPSRSRRHASATRACAPAHRVVLRATPKSIGGGWAESRPRRGVAEGNASTVACGSRRGDVRGSPVDRARPLERRRRRFLGAGEVQTEACDAPAPQARDEMAESSAGAPRLQSRARAPHRATQGAMERAAELGVPPEEAPSATRAERVARARALRARPLLGSTSRPADESPQRGAT